MPEPNLRPYQVELKAAIYAALKTHRRVLAQLPTGGGKSVVIGDIVRDAMTRNKGVIVLAHRIELVDQLAERLAPYRPHVIARGGHPDYRRDLHVAMVQTLSRRDPPLADLIIIDEAHHAVAGQYQRITDAMPNARIVGFTATPERLDGRGLGDIFDELVTGPTVRQLIDGGHLTESVVYATPLDGLSNVKTTAGDYNQGHLAAFMEKSVIRGDLVSSYRRFADVTQCIVYAANVALSRQYAAEYNAAGITAAHIDGGTADRERRAALAGFRWGAIRVLTNCALITEGFDVPACGAVQLVRPTKSLSLYLQMVGRALRPATGKDRAIILDHGENVMRHGFPDDERTWELTTTKRRKRTVQIEAREIDLPTVPRSGVEHDRTVELVRVTPNDPIPPDLRKLIQTVEERQLTNSRGKLDYYWAYKRWSERLDRKPTHTELKAFARVAGYHHQWVKHQL